MQCRWCRSETDSARTKKRQHAGTMSSAAAHKTNWITAHKHINSGLVYNECRRRRCTECNTYIRQRLLASHALGGPGTMRGDVATDCNGTIYTNKPTYTHILTQYRAATGKTVRACNAQVVATSNFPRSLFLVDCGRFLFTASLLIALGRARPGNVQQMKHWSQSRAGK